MNQVDTTAYVLADKAEIVQALLDMLMELPKEDVLTLLGNELYHYSYNAKQKRNCKRRA